MCNLYRMEKPVDSIVRLARELGLDVAFPEGVPNFEPRSVRITERAPMLRVASGGGRGVADLVERRWSWPQQGGKPLYNMRSESREFRVETRAVVLADGFYEFTPSDDPKRRTKDRWLFSWPGVEWFGIAAVWRAHPDVGEAFTLLTTVPGPDVAPIHPRQVVLLAPEDCVRWLDPAWGAASFTASLPAGTLAVERA
jgi:putative SOS response-associated peptidase YedK